MKKPDWDYCDVIDFGSVQLRRRRDPHGDLWNLLPILVRVLLDREGGV